MMQIWREATAPAIGSWHGMNNAEVSGAVITMGNFDGLHLGHQALLKAALDQPSPRVVITFDPHPLQVLYPERRLRRLLPREDLVEQLPKYGVDLLWILPFTRDFAQLGPQEFLTRLEPLAPRHVVAGYDFGFGRDRSGSLDSLRAWAASRGASMHVVPPLLVDGAPVSSRRLRDMIAVQGDAAGARRLMGRPFYLRGEVVRGAGRGAGIGIPTLNQRVVNETLPRQGVYATRTRVGGAASPPRPSVTNIGVTPTFGDGGSVKVETHVLDGVCEARGQTVDVEFIVRLRDEMKFSSIEDLKKQIQSDILKAHEALDQYQHDQ